MAQDSESSAARSLPKGRSLDTVPGELADDEAESVDAKELEWFCRRGGTPEANSESAIGVLGPEAAVPVKEKAGSMSSSVEGRTWSGAGPVVMSRSCRLAAFRVTLRFFEEDVMKGELPVQLVEQGPRGRGRWRMGERARFAAKGRGCSERGTSLQVGPRCQVKVLGGAASAISEGNGRRRGTGVWSAGEVAPVAGGRWEVGGGRWQAAGLIEARGSRWSRSGQVWPVKGECERPKGGEVGGWVGCELPCNQDRYLAGHC